MAARDGYFAPESVIRRVGNSPVAPFLGGGAAVLLQVAHPLVAAGVAAHSDYRRDLWTRLMGTLRALYLITYGSKSEAEATGERVQAAHRHVRGHTTMQLGRFPAGTPYAGDDPELMLWVHATLVDVSLSSYQRYEHALSPEEQERYYQEMNVVAQIFGTPASVIPGTLGEFREYFSAQIAGPTIEVTPPARDIAEVILAAPLPAPMRFIVPAHRMATRAHLPPRLQAEYGLSQSTLHARMLPLAARSLKLTAWPLLRASTRLSPPARPHGSRHT
ncbi:MAG TPA: oxygenase MpaB family protein [Gaiellales bacterium]|nr:oxygenase MpaB family protein [Gaiellales bacterium]